MKKLIRMFLSSAIAASFEEVEEKGFTLVPSRYIEFVNRDENIDFDTKMKTLQSELKELLIAEEKSKADLLVGIQGVRL